MPHKIQVQKSLFTRRFTSSWKNSWMLRWKNLWWSEKRLSKFLEKSGKPLRSRAEKIARLKSGCQKKNTFEFTLGTHKSSGPLFSFNRPFLGSNFGRNRNAHMKTPRLSSTESHSKLLFTVHTHDPCTWSHYTEIFALVSPLSPSALMYICCP